ncbi:hypothetical protein APHAL10511_002831 [Amanita phalloides]|nr:hypothetical protein APHAL10511_002831 [Amanita phalloides]
MWARISSALRPRTNHEEELSGSRGDVLSEVFEQHPNLSVFHHPNQNVDDMPIPTPSPPSSPSRGRRRSLFKRSIGVRKDDDEPIRAPSPVSRRPQTLPKKMMSHFNLHGNNSQTSLSRDSQGASENTRHHSDSSRKSVQEIFHLLRPSSDSPSQELLPSASVDNQPPEREMTSGFIRQGSVRSILRHPNTPATGQNVRFFSRDVYKTISPDSSQEADYQPLSPVFSESSNVQNDVDFNKGVFFGGPDASGPISSSTPAAVVISRSTPSPNAHKLTPSLSEMFTPMEDEGGMSLDSNKPGIKDKRIPAPDFDNLLDTSGHLDGPSVPPGLGDEESTQELFSAQSEPDPFSAHASTYYTPQTMIPPTPPQKQHVRKASKEENIIYSLQTQLTLQTELCGQYEADLRARDEMVEMLNSSIAEMDKEENRKKTVLRTWKKKVQELEKSVRYLEEELEDSRQEGMDRSLMDEASGEALMMLHRQIAGLEREKGEWMKVEDTLKAEIERLDRIVRERDDDVVELQETLQKKEENERERERKESLRDAKEQIDMTNNTSIGTVDEEDMRRLATEGEQQKLVELERHRAAETNWLQEKTELSMKLETIELDKGSLSEQLEFLRDQMKARDEEYSILRTELEAQWQHTEQASEKLRVLEKERAQLETGKETLKRELIKIEDKAASLEVEWQESESRRNELENELQEVWNEKETLEKERNQLEKQLQQEREQVDELTNALQERQDHISELGQEHKFATENASRLEENLRHRDQELAEHSKHIVQREADIEKLIEELSALNRNHSRELDERTRKVHDAIERAAEARAQFEESVRIKAELEVENMTNKDRVASLKEEVERLRRHVHTLQQDSADKEVKVVQMTKQLAQKDGDIAGLNIALDSKQQELELMKRRQGVRGIAGATPARPSKAHHRRDSSVLDDIPTVPRPLSVMSDSSGRESVVGNQRKRSSDSTLTASAIRISTLGKSSRINSVSSRTSSRAEGSSMGPPMMKPRASISTPTPMSRPSSQILAVDRPSIAPLSARRVPSSTIDRTRAKTVKGTTTASKVSPNNLNNSINSVSEAEEKENVALGKGVPVPV